MTLQQCTTQLEGLAGLLTDNIQKLEALEEEYYTKYRELFLASQMKTEAAREAEAKLILRNEYKQLVEEYLNTKINVRIFLTQKEICIEMSKNLRALGGGI